VETLYLYSAAIGVSLLLGQLLLSLFGVGHHDLGGGHDIDLAGDADNSHGDVHVVHPDRTGGWFVGMLSFRAIVSALSVFGLVGLGLDRLLDPQASAAAFVLALLAGAAMMYLVGWLLRVAYGLRSDGTVHIERAVGLPGRTYLTIPARKSGAGKVTVKVQGRTMEYAAMTCGEELPTGTAVVVLGVLSPQSVEVARAETASTLPLRGPAHV
jgi:membrane protein implicated in regulation of membrane protease activity